MLERLLKHLKEEADGNKGGMNNREMHKRILELEPFQFECLQLYPLLNVQKG